jgi:hypothetical protein
MVGLAWIRLDSVGFLVGLCRTLPDLVFKWVRLAKSAFATIRLPAHKQGMVDFQRTLNPSIILSPFAISTATSLYHNPKPDASGVWHG